MIERHPNLQWEFFTWRKKVSYYQSYVIVGCGNVDPKRRAHTDLAGIITCYGHLIIMSRGSLRSPETVEVRGVEMDVDDITAGHHNLEGELDRFVKFLDSAARCA